MADSGTTSLPGGGGVLSKPETKKKRKKAPQQPPPPPQAKKTPAQPQQGAPPTTTTPHTSSNIKRYIRPKKVSSVNQLRGRPGVLCTCVNGRFDELKALDEATELLTDAVEELYPAQLAGVGVPLSTDDLIAAAQAAQRVTAHDLETPGLLYFTFRDRGVDAARVCARVAARAHASRRVARLAPFNAVCFASVDETVAAAKSLLDATPLSAKVATFAVELKRRHNIDFPKDDAIKRVAALAPETLKVDLSNPDATILVHVFKSIAGVSVVEGYAARKGFNLHALRAQGENTTTASQSDKSGGPSTTTARADAPPKPSSSQKHHPKPTKKTPPGGGADALESSSPAAATGPASSTTLSTQPAPPAPSPVATATEGPAPAVTSAKKKKKKKTAEVAGATDEKHESPPKKKKRKVVVAPAAADK